MQDHLPNTNDGPATLGKAMLVGAWIAGVALLVLFFQGHLDRQHNPNPDPDLVIDRAGVPTVVLRRNRMGHYVTAGSINGSPVTVHYDWGSNSARAFDADGEQLPAMTGFWFAWYAFHPETAVFEASRG
jgi:aspartyl protease family protein